MGFARIEVLVGSETLFSSKDGCKAGFLKIAGSLPYLLNSTDLSDQIPEMALTKKQVLDTYRELGTAPKEYLDKMDKAEEKFPAGSYFYIRVVNDETGAVEGIMRVVSGNPYDSHYFSSFFTVRHDDHEAHLPMYDANKDPKFREFLEHNYPNSVEFGRLVFGKNVNRRRVLTDLFTTAVAFCRQAPKSGGPPRHALVEVVPEAAPLVEAFPFERKPIPIKLEDERTFMAANVEDFYQKFIGSAFDVPNTNIESGYKKVFDEVSSSPKLKEVYTTGFLTRAYSHFAQREFPAMLPDVYSLKKYDPNNREYRLLELLAETGTRFNWYKGKGNWKSAIAYLDSTEAKERFQNVKLPERLYSNYRTFLKGLVYLGAGKIEAAKTVRNAIEKHLVDRFEKGKQNGFIRWTAPPSLHAKMRIDTYERRIFDPKTGKGDPKEALEEIADAELQGEVGLSSELYAYKADVLDALGRTLEATQARKIAEGLR